MCGIFGYFDFRESESKNAILSDLLVKSCRRGVDAAGICLFGPTKVILIKRQGSGKKLDHQIPKMSGVCLAIGQTRLATNGSPEVGANNQPIRVKNSWMVHNGIVVNSREMAKKYKLGAKGSDSRILMKALNKTALNVGSMSEAITKLSGEIGGTINLGIVTKDKTGYKLNLATNNGSLYWINFSGLLIFASEKVFLKHLRGVINHLAAGEGIEVSESGEINNYQIHKPVVSRELVELTKIPESLKTHRLDPRIKKLKRCRKCLLPTTTPFIDFDSKGICSYCREHEKIKYGSSSKLKKLMGNYRSTNGKPDCIIAFSGGRDSAYGLHYLIKELGMHPVAVTFDWGMISDIGRRNQARMLGILGVEQIIVAADLDKVRSDIRKNLTAWLRKPDLGMVPLLMQADKVTEYYVDKIKKELGVELVFFCRGNELEKEEFKAGYCGIKNADPGGVIHNYAVIDKLRLLFYYVRQFVLNPAYLNSSLWSSMLGYLITYVVPHDYIYLWHFVKWEESKIIKTLRNEYGWEDDGETGITWRIDDGSPAFYNYLYGQIQGFTENDSFRSRQIREGLLTRERAMKIVSRENRPRYAALAWYFNKIGLNGHKVLTIIDNVKKRY